MFYGFIIFFCLKSQLKAMVYQLSCKILMWGHSPQVFLRGVSPQDFSSSFLKSVSICGIIYPSSNPREKQETNLNL